MSRSAAALPEDTLPRIRAIVEKSAPDPERPQLAPDREASLTEIERKSAGCYASMEDASAQLRKIAKEITHSTIGGTSNGSNGHD